MAELTLAWSEFWSVYRRTPESAQMEILEQLDLADIMSYSSDRVKQEIFKDAPDEIIMQYLPMDIDTPPLHLMPPPPPKHELLARLFPDPQRPMSYWLNRRKR